MEYISYIEVKESTQEYIDEFVNDNELSTYSAIHAAFEELVVPMRKYPTYYVSGFINLGIISITNGFLPDYIFNRIDKIQGIKLELTDEDSNQYHKDIEDFNNLLEAKKFEIDEDPEYMERVNLLLKE